MADTKENLDKLREKFHASDATGNGRLGFTEFLALLRKGNPSFQEAQAQTLFELCDQDMSGDVDFDEFVEYVFSNAAMDKLFRLESSADEEECKTTLLGKSQAIRAEASKACKESGENWRNLTWRQRLEEVREIEKGQSEGTQQRSAGAPARDPASSMKIPARKADRARAESSPKSPIKTQEADQLRPKTQERRATQKDGAGALVGALPKGIKMNKFAIADMNQEQLVDYSLSEDDLSFAGNNAEIKSELRAFREFLKTADSPLEKLNIIKFIAKGTAGWVFLCEDKQSGDKCAMKMIRMTQARSGIKEWYCSKQLRGISSDVVFTSETVSVVMRSQAPPVIQTQLENAGPVNHFMCMIQELMPWGTLEDLAKEGELSPEVMFKSLEDVAATLALMHENNLQHRDVKPENIMLQMDDDDTVVAAKLCDFGSAQIGNEAQSCADDIRRFGVTLFSVATGEGWTKNRLIREKHDALVERLGAAVEGTTDPCLKKLPKVLEKILSGNVHMKEVAAMMAELADAYDD